MVISFIGLGNWRFFFLGGGGGGVKDLSKVTNKTCKKKLYPSL